MGGEAPQQKEGRVREVGQEMRPLLDGYKAEVQGAASEDPQQR